MLRIGRKIFLALFAATLCALTIRAEEGAFRVVVAWFLAATAVLYFAEELTALL